MFLILAQLKVESSDESTNGVGDEVRPCNLLLNQTDSNLCLHNNLSGVIELTKASHFNFFEIIARLQQCNSISPIKIKSELLKLDELILVGS